MMSDSSLNIIILSTFGLFILDINYLVNVTFLAEMKNNLNILNLANLHDTIASNWMIKLIKFQDSNSFHCISPVIKKVN